MLLGTFVLIPRVEIVDRPPVGCVKPVVAPAAPSLGC
jgi:hypothetical protein